MGFRPNAKKYIHSNFVSIPNQLTNNQPLTEKKRWCSSLAARCQAAVKRYKQNEQLTAQDGWKKGQKFHGSKQEEQKVAQTESSEELLVQTWEHVKKSKLPLQILKHCFFHGGVRRTARFRPDKSQTTSAKFNTKKGLYYEITTDGWHFPLRVQKRCDSSPLIIWEAPKGHFELCQ